MAEDVGEKTEQPTPKKLEEAIQKGQFARSAEVQTAFVIMAALTALTFSGPEIWKTMANTEVSVFNHLHDTPLSLNVMQKYAINGLVVLLSCVWPVLLATVMGGLLAGGIQTRFQVSSEAFGINWERLNPVAGFQNAFSTKQLIPTLIAGGKLSIIVGLTYGSVKTVLADPIFHSSVSVARIAGFMATSSFSIITHVAMALGVLAAGDYGYQFWKNSQELMMTKQEIKDESKSTDGNPQVKSQLRRRRKGVSKRKMLADVVTADVVVTNPTHYAVALRYDRKSMKAPIIVAKGIRNNALEIREIARQHQIPIVENKPLARMMFKYGKVGGEIPAELYAAVAEVLAWVYRTNAYRYYREMSQ
jgi:flagellar biosynthesis protein FlhB